MPPLLDQPQLKESQKMKQHSTDKAVEIIHENATLIENMVRKQTKAVFDQHGASISMNVLLNAGITILAGGLSFIEKDSDRLEATINVFISVVKEIQLEMAENAAESIIKKAMKQ
jgi:hypothetical protein